MITKKSLHDALAARNFDIALEIEKICKSTTIGEGDKAKFIISLLDFLFPKIREPDLIQNNYQFNPNNLSNSEMIRIAKGEVIDP